jgi:hypothetical protein
MDRCHPKDDFDEVEQGHTGHTYPTSPPELAHVW